MDGQWYNYDDSRVSKASPDAVEVSFASSLVRNADVLEPSSVLAVLPTPNIATDRWSLSRQSGRGFPSRISRPLSCSIFSRPVVR